MSMSMKQIGARAVLQELRLGVITNNLANMNTTGFKEDSVVFRLPTHGVSAESPERWIWDPYRTTRTRIRLHQGQMRETGNPLDLALNGNGFFCVETGAGEEYTRKGDFTVNGDGVLVTSEGLPVIGRQGEIRLEPGVVHVDDQGNITVDGNPAGAIRIVDVGDPGMLRKSTDTRFNLPEDVEPVEIQAAIVEQGFLEGSNVNSIKAMTDMIEVLRGYESYNKVIQVLNETTQKSINEVGKLK
jgi:flagellar basal-body rod protein FlgF